MQWFRAYGRMVDDDKLRLLAFEDRWHFVALCCLKSDGSLEGEIGSLRDRRIAVRLGVQVRELEEIGRRLQEVDLVDENLVPLAWEKLQFKSDADSTAARRQREKRNRDKQLAPVTKVSRVTVTDVTRLETDTDTETDISIEPKGSCGSGEPPIKPIEIFEAWNDLAKIYDLPIAQKLTEKRKKRLAAMSKEYTVGDFGTALANIRGSPFLLGKNQNGWKADFDFFLQPSSFVKILEGSYG